VSDTEAGAIAAALCARWGGAGRIAATPAACARLGPGPWQPVEPGAAPHALHDVAVALLVAEHAVVENGALALSGREASPRALPLLCERLIALVDLSRLLPDMHAALADLGAEALAHHQYTWISGPSKTADIEATLVIGAHGPLALAVIGIAPSGVGSSKLAPTG
jgi:L-lactate utilization protein LutC